MHTRTEEVHSYQLTGQRSFVALDRSVLLSIWLILLLILCSGCARELDLTPWEFETFYHKASSEKEYEHAVQISEKALEKGLKRISQDLLLCQTAMLHRHHGEWNMALSLYGQVLARKGDPYYVDQARRGIVQISQGLETRTEQRQVYETNRVENPNLAAQALLQLAEATHELGYVEEAIRLWKQFVKAFPDHERAAEIQFHIGQVYFYELYNYEKGWPEYTRLFQDERYQHTRYARDAEMLLKRVETALEQIKHEMDYLARYHREKDLSYGLRAKDRRTGRYSIFAEQIAVTYRNLARLWEDDPLWNYPNAMTAYRELTEVLPMNYGAEALFKVGYLSWKLDRYGAALNAFADFRKHAPDSRWFDLVVYHEALCYDALWRYDKARERYRDYLKIEDATEYREQAQKRLTELEANQGPQSNTTAPH